MKKFLLLCFMALTMAACSKVPAGNVGVKVNLYGSDRGVQNQVLSPGRYWLWWNEELYTFPLFENNVEFTADRRASSPNDEAVRFQSVEGMNLSVDVSVRYVIKEELVTTLFQRYRLGIEGINRGPIYNTVRDALVQEGSKMPVDEIYGRGKNDLLQRVENRVKEELKSLGIEIVVIAMISEVRVPEAIRTSIDEKNAATQRAMQRENEVAQARAEAAKAVAVATGAAEVARLQSEAEAKAIEAKGRALRANPEILQFEAVQRWNGILPQVLGSGSTPFIQIPQLQNSPQPTR